jgi:hypothetical protein
VRFLHVPLDSYTIVGVKNCAKLFPQPQAEAIGKIPNTATMSFVKDKRMYDALQSGMRELVRKAGVPPITLDCLAWDNGH